MDQPYHDDSRARTRIKGIIEKSAVVLSKLLLCAVGGLFYSVILMLYSGRLRLAGYHWRLNLSGLLAFAVLSITVFAAGRLGFKKKAGMYVGAVGVLLALLPFLRIPSDYSELRFLPDLSPSEEKMTSLRGQPRFSQKRVWLDYEVRPGMILPVNHSINRRFLIPERSYLHFGLGIESNEDAPPLHVSVFSRGPGANRPEKLFSRIFKQDRSRWEDLLVNLEKYGGQQQDIIIQVKNTRPFPGSEVYISRPVIKTYLKDERPNIVLIVVDTLRPDHLGSYGYQVRDTDPFLRRLWRSQGVRFDSAFSTSSWTTPAVASILTSLYPPEHGINKVEHMILKDGLLTIQEVLREDGYDTCAATASWLVTASLNFCQGFDVYYDMDRFMFHWDGDKLLADRIENWLQKERYSPFFMYVHMINPHCPYSDGPLFDSSHPTVKTALMVEADRRAILLNFLGTLLFPDPPLEPDEKMTNHMLQSYDSEIKRTDKAIERVVQALQRNGLMENTLLIITSDHGDGFNEHGLFYHQNTLYQELVHVPLLIAGPMINEPGRAISCPVSLVDLLPTMMETAGIESMERRRGRSLWPLINQGVCYHRTLYCELDNRGAMKGGLWEALMIKDTKLIKRTDNGKVSYELFDLGNDPHEWNNLAAERPGRVRRLKKSLEWMEDKRKTQKQKSWEKRLYSKRKKLMKAMGYIK